MNDIVVSEYDEHNIPLTDSEKESVLAHLTKGGSPFTTHQVTGIHKSRLMSEFKQNSEFALECSKARAKCLAELEYSMYDLASSGPPREAVKALELLLKVNIPEYYNNNSAKLEDRMKRLLRDGSK